MEVTSYTEVGYPTIKLREEVNEAIKTGLSKHFHIIGETSLNVSSVLGIIFPFCGSKDTVRVLEDTIDLYIINTINLVWILGYSILSLEINQTQFINYGIMS